MKIVMVSDTCDQLNNGTTITTWRIAEGLRRKGHDVKILACGDHASPEYRANEMWVPLMTYFCHREGIAVAEPDRKMFRRAFEDADVVHFLLPLFFEKQAMKVAMQMGVPMIAAFHLQPEDVTYISHIEKAVSADFFYKVFNDYFYRNVGHIHCPSQFIADELKEHDYSAKLHVISNGIDDDFRPGHTDRGDGLFHILMVGRLSPEKRQDILIDGVYLSKHESSIQLHLAGKGPCEKELRRQAEKLTNPVTFGFYEKPDLIALIHSCDLYVHASVVEIEAIACMEAFACGLVPVISNSAISATRQFALDERSLFEADNASDLAGRIDYWFEHPAERAAMGKDYAEEGRKYRLSASVDKMEEMFREAIADSAGS
ncbi:MAG: glycosyltransferase [Lachnospiraceae bacterium]|nr:glycosyltransferase [Lachnospiraceae bacterium]